MMPSLCTVEKRIVFLHPDGIYQILGIADVLPVILSDAMPDATPAFFASLVRVTSRAGFYKGSASQPGTYGSFDRAQR